MRAVTPSPISRQWEFTFVTRVPCRYCPSLRNGYRISWMGSFPGWNTAAGNNFFVPMIQRRSQICEGGNMSEGCWVRCGRHFSKHYLVFLHIGSVSGLLMKNWPAIIGFFIYFFDLVYFQPYLILSCSEASVGNSSSDPQWRSLSVCGLQHQ